MNKRSSTRPYRSQNEEMCAAIHNAFERLSGAGLSVIPAPISW
jgi:hypothetical protein